MDGSMDWWMDWSNDLWIDGLINLWIDRWIDVLIDGLMDDLIGGLIYRSMYVHFHQDLFLYFWTQTCRINPLPRFLELLMSLQVLHWTCSCFLLDNERRKETQKNYVRKCKSKSRTTVVPSSGGTNSNRIPPISNTTSSPPRHKILQCAKVKEEKFMTLVRIDG